jgi:hypothetical protein
MTHTTRVESIEKLIKMLASISGSEANVFYDMELTGDDPSADNANQSRNWISSRLKLDGGQEVAERIARCYRTTDLRTMAVAVNLKLPRFPKDKTTVVQFILTAMEII